MYHLAKFVDVTRQKIKKDLIEKFDSAGMEYTPEQLHKLVEDGVKDDIRRGIQTLQYQILTLMTTNGQTPFCSLFIWLNEAETEELKKDYVMVIEELLKQRIKGIKNEKGAWIAPVFPKILFVLCENNYKPGTEYFYLTKLAAECTTKRMVPDYISEKKMIELKEGNVYGCMGCRSFLAPWKDPETGKYKFWGRLNTGVVTLNLPHVALEMIEENPNWDMNNPDDVKAFYDKLDVYLEYCHKALLQGHKWLEGTKASVSPILWQHGAIARLQPNETIDSKIFGGYSSSSLGYVGLYETMMALTGKAHTYSEENKQFALGITKHLNEKCAYWNTIPGENHGFSLYGTPEESTTYKFSKALRALHGVKKGITDKNYIINSYHYNVKEGLSCGVTPFKKLKFEADFQNYTSGGAISYVEAPNMGNNVEAVLTVLEFIYDNIMYAELNCKLDYCHICEGYGTIQMVKNKDNKLIWKCQNCGNEDTDKLDVSIRVCGYISSANTINQGRMEEISERDPNM